ncbi:dna repair transcription protein [Ophiostoma piceae UAMH 11346]|uniref:MMS19 nucleotide excision repair protein n=1 Tax=Ophiostoma piceae (strain UAMH 11346) TaxID=1262450 RepID=S3C625_OPHP1|nr:dna repair transcription protein [Ophiostoma piceae UAMH 11346]
MAEFTSLATSYVLADDEAEQQRIAGQAAEAIQNAPRKSAAVLGWAQSINQWMPANGGDDADSDVIIRAKALGFLAATLEVLEKDVLRVEQVEHLLKFFGAMFTIDHKAGILAASTALRCLCSMQYFRAKMAASVFEYITKLGEDFRLQVPATRRAIYDLVGLLVRNDAVLKSLGQTDGPGAQFLVDLLQLCRSERDPDNLLRWFAILRRVLERYDPPLATTVAGDVFKAASDYFPISMRSSATPAGTTVDDLKAALRGVFSASSLAASSVFDFLLQKMDQGDALTVSVKVDILSTIHACIESFAQPVQTVVPHTSRIWNSLKYEVRHGDVPETIEGTLNVVEAISARLSAIDDGIYIKDFVGVVLADCIGDLANTTFTRPAGQLLNSTMLGGYRAYNLAISSVVGTVKKDLQQAQVANQTRDLVGVLNSALKTRQTLVSAATTEVDTAAAAEFHSYDITIVDLLDSVYLRLWNNTLKETAGAETKSRQEKQDPVVLNEVIRGLAALIAQTGTLSSTGRPLLCGSSQCARIFETLAPRILASSGDADESLSQTEIQSIAHESMTALQTATSVYPAGFSFLVQQTVSSITDLISTPTLLSSPSSLSATRDTLARVAFIGCSTIPSTAGSEGQALAHFQTLTQSLFSTLEQLLSAKASFQASNAVLSGIYGAALNLRDAFVQRGVLPSVADKSKKPPVQSTAEENEAALAQKETLAQLFQAYLQEATTIVQRLYVRATATTSSELELSADFELSSSSAADLDEQDQYLHQLAGFTTFVVRDLDEAQQKEAKLNAASFNLFHTSFSGQPSFFHGLQGGRVDILSLGILKGLWPAAIASLADLSISPLNLLDDFESLDRLPPRTRLVRNTIATVVANKYSAAASIGPSKAQYPGNQAAWQQTVEAVKAKLESTGASSLTPNRFARLVAIAAGAFARLDRDAKGLASLLVFAPASHAAQPAVTPAASQYAEKAGQQMARILGGTLVSDRTLSTDDHAVVKSIYKQWVYGQTVKALLPLAFPRKTASGDGSESTEASATVARRTSTVHTIAILALVRGMPFSVYEDDVSNKDDSGVSLVRVLVAATTTLVPQWGDVAVALRVLSAILAANRGDAVRSHLKTVVDASIHVFGSQAALPASRKEALSLISQLPAHYEEGLLLPYEPRIARALATACGDRVREIRDVAQLARENWVKVAV